MEQCNQSYGGEELGAELAQLVRWMTLNRRSPVRVSTRPSEKKKSAVLLDKALYLMLVLDNDHLLSLDYEYGNGALEYVKHS